MESCDRRRWMHEWVRDNRDPAAEAWEPYPTSLRLANWMKVWWEDGILEDDDLLLASAYAQARHLRRHVETHLQGNHLFENLRAIFWAGCVFGGTEATQWRAWAAQGLQRLLDEQVLEDGGHYERSPMYHSLVLESCLDLLNTGDSWRERYRGLHLSLVEKSQAMLQWLAKMTHPDGEIALFNDAALQIAPSPEVLFEYARGLGLRWERPGPLSHLKDSGYIVVHDRSHYLVIDVGLIGPDHQPGHGHCDLFSFEWSVGPQRIICDTGVYAYQDATMRPYVRSTRAHNTVQIDGSDQSEVWKEFRVARRARPLNIALTVETDGTLRIEGAHDGYCRMAGRPVHERRFSYRNGTLVLRDTVTGVGIHELAGFIHFHPGVELEALGRDLIRIQLGKRELGTISVAQWQTSAVLHGWYCPEFGKRQRNAVLAVGSKARLPFSGRTEIKLCQSVE